MKIIVKRRTMLQDTEKQNVMHVNILAGDERDNFVRDDSVIDHIKRVAVGAFRGKSKAD
jgi:hypothetical protein